MLDYLRTKDDVQCCGCRACEQVCPKGALTMQENSEGFLYPSLKETLCVNCGLCEKVCPVMNRPEGDGIQAVYAIQHKENEILKDSSSGGAFRLLADEMIRRGGYVVGCVWDESYRPVLRIAHSVEELHPMQGSKYLSSDTKNIYCDVKGLLESGKEVLFTGTPCQCAGILTYLRKPYENLLTADFICHGVPSQFIFDSYLDAVEKKSGISAGRKKTSDGVLCTPTHKNRRITSYKFRDKERRGWGLVSTYTWMHGKKEKKYYAVGVTDPYNYGFLNGYFNRYICYPCPFRGTNRFTDFTFCDYWGIDAHHNELDANKGVSAIAINSEKGQRYYQVVEKGAISIATQAEWVAVQNPSLIQPEIETVPALRRTIYGEIDASGWKAVERKHLRCKGLAVKRMWYALPSGFTRMIRKILGR